MDAQKSRATETDFLSTKNRQLFKMMVMSPPPHPKLYFFKTCAVDAQKGHSTELVLLNPRKDKCFNGGHPTKHISCGCLEEPSQRDGSF